MDIAGEIRIFTGGGRVGITSDSVALNPVQALVHIENLGEVSCGLRVQAFWQGSTATPYQNNDVALFEVFNRTVSDSGNRSWAGSFSNSFHDIPAGVTDSGTRVGVLGWATSTAADPSYIHNGTLTEQVGVYGRAGFQGLGAGTGAITTEAVGVRGEVVTDSPGATIGNAIAGQFVTRATEGEIIRNTAVYASARSGEINYSLFGADGVFYNKDPVRVGNEFGQSSAYVAARSPGNAYEFGHPDSAGYASNIGATNTSGSPFLAFCAEADPTGNTFRTRGKKGVVVSSDLSGSLIFSRVNNPNASGQTLVESGRIDNSGHLILAETPRFPSRTPASANAIGSVGEVCWDGNFVYVCIATNAWKRCALSSW